MKFTNSIHIIDTHASGEPVRIITGGIPHLCGETMLAKMEYMEQNQYFIGNDLEVREMFLLLA